MLQSMACVSGSQADHGLDSYHVFWMRQLRPCFPLVLLVLMYVYVSVSLQQMVLFGQHPSQGTLLKASQFLAGELLKEFSVHPTPIDGRPSCHVTYMSR